MYERLRRHRNLAALPRLRTTKIKRYAGFVTSAMVILGVAVASTQPWTRHNPVRTTQAIRYLGLYEPDAPHSYAGINKFAQAIGRQPNLVSYYSSLTEPFQAAFATWAAERGAITLDQMDAANIPLESIAQGRYDSYLRSYASEVKAFGAKVIVSFDHEMNGAWYSWGYKNTSPAAFIAAWRHIVTVFRELGVRNVIWLWTVNIINTFNNLIPDPARWWPGSSYVDWVGLDGYYFTSSWTFASLFGPTITDVRELTGDPILIAETGAASAAGQAAKITDLFRGVRTYGLLGFLWFDMDGETAIQNWRIRDPAVKAVFRQDAAAFMRPEPAPSQ